MDFSTCVHFMLRMVLNSLHLTYCVNAVRLLNSIACKHNTLHLHQYLLKLLTYLADFNLFSYARDRT